MKKIVALVLCLALALSLCTVAFAAKADLAQINGDAESSANVTLEEDAAPKYKDNKVKTVGNVEYWAVKSYTAGTTPVVGIADGDYLVEDDINATHVLTYKGNEYRVKVADADDIFYSYVATKITAVNTDACGSVIDEDEDNTFVTYTDADGAVHIAMVDGASGKNVVAVLLDGAVKTVADIDVTFDEADLHYVGHDWELVDADDDGVIDSKELVKCSVCGATSKIYTSNTAAISGTIFEALDLTENRADGTADGFAAASYNWMTGTASGSTSDTVESAKTFDAGIALYAGMALASVAGSAVVIGKQKEF